MLITYGMQTLEFNIVSQLNTATNESRALGIFIYLLLFKQTHAQHFQCQSELETYLINDRSQSVAWLGILRAAYLCFQQSWLPFRKSGISYIIPRIVRGTSPF